MTQKFAKIKQLEKQLALLEKVELPKKLKSYGVAYQSSSDAWQHNAAFELARCAS